MAHRVLTSLCDKKFKVKIVYNRC